MTEKICPFMSHRAGHEMGHDVVLCYREECAAWKIQPAHGYRKEVGPGGYCVRIWGPE